MWKIAALILALSSAAALPSMGADDEFYITCDAPVLVGAGIVRYFVCEDGRRLSVKYAFGGKEGNTVLIEKTTFDPCTCSRTSETIKVQLSGPNKTGDLEISGHCLRLKMNGDGRLIVKEMKG